MSSKEDKENSGSDEYGGVVEAAAAASADDDDGKASDKKDEASDQKEDEELKRLGANYKRDSGNGELIYVDPSTKAEFVLNKDKTDWIPKEQRDQRDYDFDGKTYYHTDEKGVKHKWDLEKQAWTKIAGTAEMEEEEESEEDDDTTDEQRKERMFRKRKAQPGWGTGGEYLKDPDTGVQLYRDAKDGMLYEWDGGKNAWFPRIDEDFMAQYQMSYGFDNDGAAKPTMPDPEPDPEAVAAEKAKKATEDAAAGKKAPAKKPQWFEDDSEKSTKVYVCGLPLNFDEEKLHDLMSKCGIIEIDVRTNKPKLKLYRDEENKVKGDALCTYMKPESVELALTILDGSVVGEGGTPISVERAKFEMKGGAYNPKLKAKKLSKKEQERLKKKKEKMFAWEPDKMRGERNKRDKVIVIENVFSPEEFDRDPTRILECSSRLREYCGKFGSVRKVVVYDKRKDGVCQVFFGSPEEADMAISMLDGRMYGDKRVLKAFTWDGKTKYKVNETEEEEKERLRKWDEFLLSEEKDEDEEADKEKKK